MSVYEGRGDDRKQKSAAVRCRSLLDGALFDLIEISLIVQRVDADCLFDVVHVSTLMVASLAHGGACKQRTASNTTQQRHQIMRRALLAALLLLCRTRVRVAAFLISDL